MSKIKVLDAEVIQRISAGEVLQRPVNAVKELLENSLDAGADRITIYVQVPVGGNQAKNSNDMSNGLFSIQVTDNGSGIDREDFAMLCERHATSKLQHVEDLREVSTFGFRGEALASCSQVARVEVISKSRESKDEVSWKANYAGGMICGEPTPIAGNFGTIIHIRDLFYGNRVRREALLNSSEEYQKILQVVQMYALDMAGRCSFSLSRRRDRIDVQTSLNDTHVNVVKSLWGDEIGAALLPFTIQEDAKLGLEAGNRGWATRTTFHKLKSPIVIIFLNGRLIEHSSLRRALLQAFAQHLPTSPPAHPFIYLSLRLRGNRVDVNVHPSKRQVFFLDEAEIIGRIVEAVARQVLDYQYETQPLRPLLIKTLEEEQRIVGKKREKESVNYINSNMSTTTLKPNSNNPVKMAKISTLYPSQRVLTDHKNHKMDTFLFHASQGVKKLEPEEESENNRKWISVESKIATVKKNDTVLETENSGFPFHSVLNTLSLNTGNEANKKILNADMKENEKFNGLVVTDCGEKEKEKLLPSRCPSPISNPLAATIESSAESSSRSLTGPESSQLSESVSVSDLDLSIIEWISERSNEQLSKLLRPSTVVGLIDSKWVLLQSGTNLLLGEMERLNFEMFFTLLAAESLENQRFVHMLEVNFSIADAFEEDSLVQEAEDLIKSQEEFLKINFGIVFESAGSDCNGRLVLKSIPQVIPGQRAPPDAFLSTFLQRLCLVPDYEGNNNNKAEFGLRTIQVMKEVAMLLSIISVDEWEDWQEYVKHVIVPNYRDSRVKFSMANNFSRLELDSDNDNDDEEGGTDEIILNTLRPPIQIITNTETLYKSFERC